jgi:hypothetical protein
VIREGGENREEGRRGEGNEGGREKWAEVGKLGFMRWGEVWKGMGTSAGGPERGRTEGGEGDLFGKLVEGIQVWRGVAGLMEFSDRQGLVDMIYDMIGQKDIYEDGDGDSLVCRNRHHWQW